MAELDRASPAFDQTLPVHVELPGREPRTEDLVVRVLLGSKQSGTQRSKVQHVEVTSDADLCMLFAMDVSEEDFHLLKQDQSILIDFHNFPEMLIELLCKCGGDGGDGASRYSARLKGAPGGDAVLNLVQTNHFKDVTHLSLRLVAGDDAAVKSYLASRLDLERTVCSRTKDALDSTSARLEATRGQLEDARSRLDSLERTRERDEAQQGVQHSEALQELRERLTREREEAVAQVQQEHRRQAAEQSSEAQSLRARLAEVEEALQSSRERCLELESSQRAVTQRAESAEKEAEAASYEIRDVRSENRELDKARFNNEKALAAATAHKQALEQQVRDKEDIAGRMRALLEAAAEQKATLEASLASYKESVDALQRKLEGSVDEITRGNEVIARLHRERKAERQKLKLKGQVVLQQERSLEEKGRLLEEARRETRELERRVAALADERDAARREAEAQAGKLQESAKLLTRNKETIAFLNKRINEERQGSLGTAAYGGGGGGGKPFTPSRGGLVELQKPSYAAYTAPAGNNGATGWQGRYASPEQRDPKADQEEGEARRTAGRGGGGAWALQSKLFTTRTPASSGPQEGLGTDKDEVVMEGDFTAAFGGEGRGDVGQGVEPLVYRGRAGQAVA